MAAQPVGSLRVDLSASIAAFKTNMKAARDSVFKNGSAMQRTMHKVKRSFDNTIKSIGMIAGAYVGFYAGVRAIKSIITEAANYETALINMAKVTDQSFEIIDKTIKGVAPEIGNYTELMKGYYQVISAGVTDPKKALDMLTVASKTAKVAGIDQGETVKALTKLMTGYAGEIKTATDASDLLLAIEKKGQTQVSELVPVIGKLATISRMAGLSAEEMGGAFAILTQTSGSTAEAADILSASLTTLLKPTPQMIKEFERVGGAINFIQESGFEAWLRRIQKASGGTQAALTKMLGGKKNASIGIASLLAYMDTLNGSIAEMTNRTGKLGNAWTEYEKTTNAALDKFRNNIHNIEIVLGTALLPALNDVAGKTGDWVKQNEKLIGQKFDEYVKATGAALKTLVSVYNSMPDGAIDAGIVGFILAGKYGPLKLAIALVAINDAMHNIGNSFGDIRGKSDALSENVKNIWDVLTGKRDWNTGKLKDGLKEVAKEAENTSRVIIDISKSIKALSSSDGDGGIDPVINPNEEAIQRQIKALELLRDTYGMIATDITLYKLALKNATPEQLKLAESILETTENMKAVTATDDAIIQMMADIDEGAKASAKSLQDMAEEGKSAMEVLTDAVKGFGDESAQAITDFALTGKTSFSDMIDSMIHDLIKMMVYQQITGPLFSSISGGLGSLFTSAKGNAFQGGNVIPFAKGGIVTRPTVFPMAQGAGLMGEAGPEAVLPLKRGAGGNLGVEASGGGVEVNIINNVGADVTTSERKTAGGIEIDVMIDNAVAKKLGQFGSQSNKAMRQNYGAQQRLTGR